MTKLRIWTEEEINWLIANYSELGCKLCSEHLRKTANQISAKIEYLAKTRNIILHISKERKFKIYQEGLGKFIQNKTYDYRVNANQFYEIKTPETAYILGLIWSDGHVSNKKSYRINIGMVKEDLSTLVPIFQKLGNWSIRSVQMKNRKLQLHISTSNKPLVNFLMEKDYITKSIASADKILEIVPDDLKP